MGLYKGISKKKMSDGSTSIMVRFKHLGITYPVKNFTKIFGCQTEKAAFDKLGEVKSILSKGKNPFASSKNTLSEIFDEKIKLYEENKTWGYWTVRNHGYFFNKHIKPYIGKKKIEKIKYEDIKKILDNFEKDQHGNKNKVLDILKPIFREELNKGNILENVMDKFVKKRYSSQKEAISIRSKTKPEDIVRQLYKSIPLYGREQAWARNIEQHRMFLYMVLMTAHRTGEIIQLEKKHCHLDERLIIAPKEITKTNEDYHYPIPDECFEYIQNHKGGKLFSIPKGGTTDRVFRRLVNLADIDTISHYNVSAHDTRKLMMSIMIGHLEIDSRLADYCLDHKQQGVIKHYLEFTYEDKAKAYKKYWNFIRNIDTDQILKETQNKEIVKNSNNSNFEKLEKLVNMLENGYITKEMFEMERDKLFL